MAGGRTALRLFALIRWNRSELVSRGLGGVRGIRRVRLFIYCKLLEEFCEFWWYWDDGEDCGRWERWSTLAYSCDTLLLLDFILALHCWLQDKSLLFRMSPNRALSTCNVLAQTTLDWYLQGVSRQVTQDHRYLLARTFLGTVRGNETEMASQSTNPPSSGCTVLPSLNQQRRRKRRSGEIFDFWLPFCVSSNLASRPLPTADLHLSYEERKRAIKHGELQENREA